MSTPTKLVVGACSSAFLALASLHAQNTVSGASTSSGITAGNRNLIFNASYSFIGGGFTNVLVSGANFSTIGGGFSNAITAGSIFAVVGGGSQNLIGSNATNATIGGGAGNRISASNPVLFFTNTASFSTVGGGLSNAAGQLGCTVAGGMFNQAGINGGNSGAGGSNSTVAGGRSNSATANASFVGGGLNNSALGIATSVGGGINNEANGFGATIAGGQNNDTAENYTAVGGGLGNDALGIFGAVPGGASNLATTNAFAAGIRAKATNQGAFVWSSAVETSSTNTNSFTVRSPGGARFITATNLVGVVLAPGATAWAALSDSNAKTDVEPINAREVLKKVAALPVTSWHYKHDLNRRYIGPMAQDFHAAFGLGADDKTITTLDTDGVTLAAIKGLVEELKERDAEIAGLKARNARLEARDAEIEARLEELSEKVSHLPPAP